MIIKKDQKLGLRRAKTHKYYILTDWHKSTTLDNIRVNIWSFDGIAYYCIGQPKHDTLQYRKVKVKA
jgi:hypothetical protein